MEQINKINIEETLVLRMDTNVSILWFYELQPDIHLGISYHVNDTYVNLHVTRNVSDPTNKPKITICKIKKDALETFLPHLSIQMMRGILEPVDTRRRKDYLYISFQNLQYAKNFSRLRTSLTDTFKKVSRQKGKRELKINKSFEDDFSAWGMDKNMQYRLLKNFKNLPRKFKSNFEGGILLSRDRSDCVLVIHQKMYRFKNERTGNPLESIVPLPRLKSLSFKLTMAIARVKQAKNYADTKLYDNPTELFVFAE